VAGRGLAEVEADISRDAQSRAGGRPSLLQDVMRKRRTEVEFLNGYVVREGRKTGVATPINEAVVDLYRGHGVGALVPDPRNLEPLLKLLP
jgi:2-dehydropantoate 2-reductase